MLFEGGACGSTPNRYEGILGLGPTSAALPGTSGYLDALVASGFMPDVLAFQLCDTGGTLWLGGFDAAYVTADPQYVPALALPALAFTPYAVDLAGVVVKGTNVPVQTAAYPGTMIDTGTSAFILQSEAFNGITAAITNDPQFQSIVSSDPTWFDSPENCVSIAQTKPELDSMLPALTLVYGTPGASISVTAVATESYLVGYEGLWCSALDSFTPTNNNPYSAYLGMTALKSAVTIIDRAGQRVGFAPHVPCP
jgi:hypothetical protein